MALSHTLRPSLGRFAFDLYRKRLLDVDLAFSNPFRMTTMLGYNFDTKVGTGKGAGSEPCEC